LVAVSSADFSFPFLVALAFWDTAFTGAFSIPIVDGPAQTLYIDANTTSLACENYNKNIPHM
jgi:hypothetical protein